MINYIRCINIIVYVIIGFAGNALLSKICNNECFIAAFRLLMSIIITSCPEQNCSVGIHLDVSNNTHYDLNHH